MVLNKSITAGRYQQEQNKHSGNGAGLGKITEDIAEEIQNLLYDTREEALLSHIIPSLLFAQLFKEEPVTVPLEAEPC